MLLARLKSVSSTCKWEPVWVGRTSYSGVLNHQGKGVDAVILKDNWLNGQGRSVVLLAHGAGAPADSPYMDMLARALAGQGVSVMRFEFDYMNRRRQDGRKRPPGKISGLLDEFHGQVETVSNQIDPQTPVFVAGKSMGGRVASMLAADPSMVGRVNGAIGFGYPFHPPGKPDRWRTDHFAQLARPLCIVQGTRDPFGKQDEVTGQDLSPGLLELHWLDGGDHDFLPLKRQPESQSDLIGQAAGLAAGFMSRCRE